MKCRPHCGACCIIPSISSALPDLPEGKPAYEKCIHLDSDFGCKIFGLPERPDVCVNFTPTTEVCGDDRDHAMAKLTQWEEQSRP